MGTDLSRTFQAGRPRVGSVHSGHEGLLREPPLDWEDLLIGKTAGAGRLCQPIPLFSFSTWLSISLFLEASGTAPSQFSPFNPLYAHLPQWVHMAYILFIGFFLSHRCLLDLLDRMEACSVWEPYPPVLFSFSCDTFPNTLWA